jgi:hypothetical protein
LTSDLDEASVMRLPRLRLEVRHVVVAVLASLIIGVFIGLSAPPAEWVRSAFRTLRFRVVEVSLGVPVRGARVALVRPNGPAQLPNEGLTDASGQVELRGVFRECGGTYAWGRERVTYFTYRPWEVQVRAEGFEGYTAALGDWDETSPEPPGARETLKLSDPAPRPIVIRLKPMPARAR